MSFARIIILLNKTCSLASCNWLPWQQENVSKTPFLLALDAGNLKMNLVTPIFYCWKIIKFSRTRVLNF